MDELNAAQAQLGRALDEARAGEDRVLAGKVREEGERLVKLLNGLLAMARLHAPDNHAFDQPVRDLEGSLTRLVDLIGVVHLLTVEDQVYINEIRIRLEGSDAVRDLGGKLRPHVVGGISFHAPLSDPQIRAFVSTLGAAPAGDRPRDTLADALARQKLDVVELSGLHRFRMSGETPQAGVRDAKVVAARAVSLIEEAWDNLGAHRSPNPLPLRRAVAEILEGDAKDLLAVPEAGASSSAYAAHTLRVCRAALAIGRALGLSEALMQDLGVAALFHDVGYSAREGEATRNDGSVEPGYPPPFARHPVATARVLLRQRGFHTAKVRRVEAALDHHRRFDDAQGRPSLFGRILAIAEDFDTAVRPGGASMPPAQALGRLMAGSGTIYDPVLLQLFVNVALDAGLANTAVAPVAPPPAPAPSAPPPAPPVEEPAAPRPTGIAVVAPPELGGSRHQLYEGVLPEVLREIYVGKKTGVLHLSRAGEKRSVRFWKGHIVHAQSSVKSEHMGEVAIREGLLSATDLERATEIVTRDERPLGAAIRALGILSDAAVEDMIALHAREVLEKAIPWNDGTYDFDTQPAPRSWFDEMTLRLSTADVILAAVRKIQAPDVIRFHLGDIDRVLVSAVDPAESTRRATLAPLDGFVLSRVDGILTAREVIRIVPHEPKDVQRSLFGLLCIGLLLYARKG